MWRTEKDKCSAIKCNAPYAVEHIRYDATVYHFLGPCKVYVHAHIITSYNIFVVFAKAGHRIWKPLYVFVSLSKHDYFYYLCV